MSGLEIPALIVGIAGAAAGTASAYKDLTEKRSGAVYRSSTTTQVVFSIPLANNGERSDLILRSGMSFSVRRRYAQLLETGTRVSNRTEICMPVHLGRDQQWQAMPWKESLGSNEAGSQAGGKEVRFLVFALRCYSCDQ